jgi:(p)ppGpp synthase/HD superfamily hydrolase
MQEQNMWDQDLYITAWNSASKAHSKQFMPGSDIPYVNHIGLVAMEVMSAICQPQTEKMALYQPIKNANLAIVCALLHDTIEDTEISFNDIVKHFDEAIAYGVLALTKDKKLPNKQEQMLDSLQRIKQQPLEVGMVKLADRITNLQSPPHYWTKEKIKNYCLEAQNILNALGHANEYLAQRLAYKIKNYQQYCL